MSEEDVEIVRRAMDAFNRRDAERFAQFTTPGFEWLPALPSALDAPSYVGHAGVRRYFSEIGDTWDQLTLLAETLRDLDGVVLMLGRAIGRGLGSGATVEMPLAFLAEFRDGLISKASTYRSHDEAVNAAGIVE